jgi:NAD(P)-dependent dehydrogenase (short-subunit alcohol dehydrogenase family)
MPKTPDYFVGKTIVITGAGGGIGRAAALIFAREGANVVVTDIDADAARRVAETIQQGGRQAIAVRVDVTERVQTDAAIVRAGEFSLQLGRCGGEPLQVPGDR